MVVELGIVVGIEEPGIAVGIEEPGIASGKLVLVENLVVQ